MADDRWKVADEEKLICFVWKGDSSNITTALAEGTDPNCRYSESSIAIGYLIVKWTYPNGTQGRRHRGGQTWATPYDHALID